MRLQWGESHTGPNIFHQIILGTVVTTCEKCGSADAHTETKRSYRSAMATLLATAETVDQQQQEIEQLKAAAVVEEEGACPPEDREEEAAAIRGASPATTPTAHE